MYWQFLKLLISNIRSRHVTPKTSVIVGQVHWFNRKYRGNFYKPQVTYLKKLRFFNSDANFLET